MVAQRIFGLRTFALLAALALLPACENPVTQALKDTNSAVPKEVKSTPTISTIADDHTPLNVAKAMTFRIADEDTSLSCETSVSVRSTAPTLTPAISMVSTGTAPACTLTITPATGISGTATITVYVSNGTKSASTSFNFTVISGLLISGTPVVTALTGTAYAGFTATGTGGLAPLTYSVASGSLPTGVTLNSTTGVVSGTPTVTGNFSGIVIRVTDALGSTANLASFTLSVASYKWDFKTAASLDGTITYTRTGGATRTNSSGLVETVAYSTPRFDYNSSSLALKGLLAEQAASNFLSYTDHFESTIGWPTKTRSSVTADAATSPAGDVTADKFFEDATAANTHIMLSANLTNGTAQTYTFSIYAKAAGRSALTLYFYGASTANRVQTTCNLAGSGSVSGTTSVGTFSGATAGIQSLANSWYRCWVTGLSDNAANMRVEVHLNNGASDTYSGDSASGVYLWGPQLEASSVPTSYLPGVNILPYSEQLDQASGWTAGNSAITGDSTAGPDGFTNADTINDNSAAGLGRATSANLTVANDSNTYTVSTYVKNTGSGIVAVLGAFSLGTGVTRAVAVDLANGNCSAASVGTAPASCTVTLQNNYYRISFQIANNSTGNTRFVMTLYSAFAAALAGNGMGFSTVGANASTGSQFFWGSQLEIGSAVTPYVRRSVNAIRGQDNIHVNTLGSWFDATNGTMVSEATLVQAPAASVSQVAASLNDGTASNHVQSFFSSTGGGMDVMTAGVQQTNGTVASVPSGTVRLATTYATNDLQAALANTLGANATSNSVPTVSKLSFGQDGNSGSFLNGILREMTYFPARVPAATLQSLSQ